MITLALIDQAANWWGRLAVAEQLFYGIALTAGIIAVVLMVLSALGLGHDDAVDGLSADAAHDDGGGVISLKTLTGFFLGFGWIGGMAIAHGLSLLLSIFLACLAGAVMMGLIVLMLRALLSMRSDGTARISDTVGEVGTVYLTVPPRKASGGQVTVNFKGRQETYAALQSGENPIASGDKVKVIALVDTRTLLVETL